MGLETIANILFSKIYHKEKNTREQKSQVATLFIKKKKNQWKYHNNYNHNSSSHLLSRIFVHNTVLNILQASSHSELKTKLWRGYYYSYQMTTFYKT